MTVIIDTDVNLHHHASSKVDLFRDYVESHRRCNVLVVYFLSCSYLEQLTDYRYLCFVQLLILLCNLVSFTSYQNVGCSSQAGWISDHRGL